MEASEVRMNEEKESHIFINGFLWRNGANGFTETEIILNVNVKAYLDLHVSALLHSTHTQILMSCFLRSVLTGNYIVPVNNISITVYSFTVS